MVKERLYSNSRFRQSQRVTKEVERSVHVCFQLRNINKADCKNRKKAQNRLVLLGESKVIALYRNATDYATLNHLTLLPDKYSL